MPRRGWRPLVSLGFRAERPGRGEFPPGGNRFAGRPVFPERNSMVSADHHFFIDKFFLNRRLFLEFLGFLRRFLVFEIAEFPDQGVKVLVTGPLLSAFKLIDLSSKSLSRGSILSTSLHFVSIPSSFKITSALWLGMRRFQSADVQRGKKG